MIADDLPPPAPGRSTALAGAVGEALTNAGKHGAADTVTVFVEPGDDGGLFCAVKDDGTGFDTASTKKGSASRGRSASASPRSADASKSSRAREDRQRSGCGSP